jgi:pyruvate formate-lyase/glycerol dehydratase family glycyl radical enzyme
MEAIVTERKTTEGLRDEMASQLKQKRVFSRIGDKKVEQYMPYRPGVKICIERARLLTQSYKKTEGEPMVLRRAKALAYVLDNMTVWIGKNERIVGNFASTPEGIIPYPELFVRWLDKSIEKEYKPLLTEEERKELHEIHKYWENLAVHGMERSLLPEDILPYWFYQNHGAFMWLHGARTGVPNFDKLFRLGLNGIIKEATDRSKEIASDPKIRLDGREYLEQKHFLDAAIIIMKAAIRWGWRYAEKAREMAAEEKDETRKKELEEIARLCDWVPGNPARTLHEALQCYYFVIVLAKVIDLQTTGTGDRFDQIMYPFYKKDMEEGRITREQAQELVEFVFLKQNEFGDLMPPYTEALALRVSTIGGVTPKGDDATNEMTYIAMDAKDAMGLAQPALSIRLHNRTPKALMYRIVEALRKNAGVYSFFNDNFYLQHLTGLGIPLEDARDYAIEGCMRWIIPGKSMAMRALGGNFVLPKCLEYALNRGIDKFSGKQWGYPTPDPATFTSIEDVIQAYLTQVRFFTEKLVTIYNIVDVLDEQYLPQPFLSALMDGCIERGRDCRTYKYFAKTILQPVGHITVANSIAAMKKLMFDDKKVTMAELLEALKNDWEGHEELRQKFLDAPKFGNDDDYVDLIARDIVQRSTDLVHDFKNIYGGHFMCDGTGGSSYFRYSGMTGATPDGRKDRDVFNDGTISPSIGTDVKGPSAVLKSVGKVDHARSFTQLFNQKFMPQFLADEYKDAFVAYMRTWLDMGIHQIQFNVVDKNTLVEAKKDPEKYPKLVVRVAGFSAYFIDLAPGVQDQIIQRTDQTFA